MQRGKHPLELRHQRQQSLELVRARDQHHNGDGKSLKILLVTKVLVDVMNASKSAAASLSKAPFFTPLHPILPAVFTKCSGKDCRSLCGTDSSRSSRIGKKS